MRKKNFWKSLMLGLASTAVVACSSDELQDDMSVVPGDAQPEIVLKVATPGAGSVVVEGGARALHTSEEWAVKNLNVYLFKKTTVDNTESYVYYDKYTFTANDQTYPLTGGTNNEAKYNCTLKIAYELMNETVRIFLIANEEGTVELAQNTTTLEAFKETMAKAAVTNGNHVDALVNYTVSDVNYGFAMAAQAVGEDDATEFKLEASGVEVNATLVRNVARIDIVNDTPNLTVTNVTMHNTPTLSYLFAQDASNLYAAPASASVIDLLPNSKYFTTGDNPAFSPLAYATGEGADNTYEQMLYIYEQAAASAKTDANCPYVTIDYQLTMEDKAGNPITGNHSINIYFGTDTEEGWRGIPVERNHLYKIILGDGSEIDNLVSLDTKVEVWEEKGENEFVMQF